MFLCSAVMNGIKARMHLRRFSAAVFFISLIYFPIAKSIKKRQAKKTWIFSRSGWVQMKNRSLDEPGVGVVREPGGSITKWWPRKRKTSLKSISILTHSLVCRCFHFVHAFDWKHDSDKKQKTSQMLDLCEHSSVKCGDDGFLFPLFGENFLLNPWKNSFKSFVVMTKMVLHVTQLTNFPPCNFLTLNIGFAFPTLQTRQLAAQQL